MKSADNRAGSELDPKLVDLNGNEVTTTLGFEKSDGKVFVSIYDVTATTRYSFR